MRSGAVGGAAVGVEGVDDDGDDDVHGVLSLVGHRDHRPRLDVGVLEVPGDGVDVDIGGLLEDEPGAVGVDAGHESGTRAHASTVPRPGSGGALAGVNGTVAACYGSRRRSGPSA